MKRVAVFCLLAVLVLSLPAAAQSPQYGNLDGKPYDPETEPNIDMFMASWKESMPRHIFGSLIERDIFTKNDGDPLKPKSRGAVLTDCSRLSHATLMAHAVTMPSKLEGEQVAFYIVSGKGIMETKSQRAELYEGVGVLMPPDLEFTMVNTGDEALTMYLVGDPVPAGAEANKDMVVRDENVLTPASSNVHWCHIYKLLFGQEHGLKTIVGMGPVWFDPMTMGQPHSHDEGVEEIWFSLDGDVTILLGKQIRKFPPGMAYKIPANGATPHSTINVTDEPVKVFWFMKVPTI